MTYTVTETIMGPDGVRYVMDLVPPLFSNICSYEKTEITAEMGT